LLIKRGRNSPSLIKGGDTMRATRTINVEVAVWQAIEKLARETGLSRSRLVERILMKDKDIKKEMEANNEK